MSILASKRKENQAEYVAKARKIHVETLNFLSRLSSRYGRMLGPETAKLAAEVEIYAEKANGIYPSSPGCVVLRERHLLEAKASLNALDGQLGFCFEVMALNPEGCYRTQDGLMEAKNASRKLDKTAERLGALIDEEYRLLQGVLDSDKRRAKQMK